MRLHVLYRTHAGSNDKPRPPFYDRLTAWESLQASLAAVPDAAVTLVVDGDLPADLVAAIGSGHRQVTVSGGRASSSFRSALAVAAGLVDEEPADTLFLLAEDDYLYRPEAISDLLAAAVAVPEADYFALHTAIDEGWYATHPSQPEREVPSLPGGPVTAGTSRWDRIPTTTSTFAVRSAALAADRWLLDLASRAGAPFDVSSWHALQGFRPFAWRHLLSDLHPEPSLRGAAKVVGKPVMRGLLDVAAAVARPSRVLVAPAEDLAMHLEPGQVAASGWDWAGLAERVAAGRDAERPAAG
ncbi:hypothetical protein [Modestobacter versicolor]|uniref:hypothetical protein n=1 Tax=Modestobacter versicolor TaxID=429133 RepID=UPI0034DE651A